MKKKKTKGDKPKSRENQGGTTVEKKLKKTKEKQGLLKRLSDILSS